MKRNDIQAMVAQSEAAARLLKQLAHPRRLQLLCRLADGEKTVGQLKNLCGVSQSQLSQFLGRMKSEGLVAARRDGRFSAYRIQDPRLLRLMRALHGIFCSN
jgi:ArsR family transcriptional regulator